MGYKDLHEKPFDDATLLKLDLFERYLEEWLPTFIHTDFHGDIQIWDFFAGQGYDIIGQRGSPVRIVDVIAKFEKNILERRKKVHVHLNELNSKKYALLSQYIVDLYEELPALHQLLHIHLYNDSFEELYQKSKSLLRKGNNFIFLDQNGVKQITEPLFQEIISFRRTDFMFFISSSYFNRFATDFKKIHPKLDVDEMKKTKYLKIHLAILKLYKSYIPKYDKRTKLFPFSIKKQLKKGYNIYGLIFGARHVAAVDKFLRVAWDENKMNGQANYDIEDDLTAGQIDIFSGVKRLTKIEKFEQVLRNKLLAGELKSNHDVYHFTLDLGHVSSHASKLLRSMKAKKEIFYKGRDGVSYNAMKEKRVVVYSLKEN